MRIADLAPFVKASPPPLRLSEEQIAVALAALDAVVERHAQDLPDDAYGVLHDVAELSEIMPEHAAGLDLLCSVASVVHQDSLGEQDAGEQDAAAAKAADPAEEDNQDDFETETEESVDTSDESSDRSYSYHPLHNELVRLRGWVVLGVVVNVVSVVVSMAALSRVLSE